jgi:hypothetical protein
VVKANYVCRILRHRNKRERVGEDWMEEERSYADYASD